MKPLHLVALGAVLVVGVAIWLLRDEGGDRFGSRTDAERSSTSRASLGDRSSGSTTGPAAARRSGPLTATLKIVAPDGESPAGGAEVEISGGIESAETADAGGIVRIDGLQPGLYGLIARHGDAVGSLRFELKRTTDLGTLRLAEAVAIRGHVYDARGEPIPGATVEAVDAPSGGGFDFTRIISLMTQPEAVAARATTGADGAYELRVAAGGSFGVRALATGFAQEGEGSRAYTTDTDGLDFYLMPGAMLSGRVVSSRGMPVGGARVMLVDSMAVLGERTPKAGATSDAEGAFALTVTPSARMLMIVRATGYATLMDGQLKLPDLDRTVTLERGISVRLRTVQEHRPRVPAAGVQVALGYNSSFAAGETDELGELVLENMPEKQSAAMGGRSQGFLWGGGYVTRTLQVAADKKPADGQLDLGDVEMTLGGVVKGKVLDKVTGGPVAGAQVRSFGGQDMQMAFIGGSKVLSGPDGAYELTGVPLKANLLVATHPEYVNPVDPMMLGRMMAGGRKPLFDAGKREAEQDIQLDPAVAVTGVVLDPDGRPVGGARVQTTDQTAMFTRILGGGPGSVVTGADGRFRLSGMSEGKEVSLRATHREFGSSDVKKAGAGGAELTLELTEPLQITGLVVDESNAALPGVRVTVARKKNDAPGNPMMGALSPGGPTRPSVTGDKGRFLIRNAPPGDLIVTFSHTQYQELKVPLSVRRGAGGAEMERTVLPRGLGIEGVVVDPEGKPVPSVAINGSFAGAAGMRPSTSGARNWAQAVSDKDGRFALYGLREGKYRLQVWRQGSYSTRPLVETGKKDAKIVVSRAATLLGRVTSNGLPVAGASVRAVAERKSADFSNSLGWAQSGPEGTFELDSLPPDQPFHITITHDGHREGKFDNLTATDRRQEFTLDAGVQIAGTVVDLRGGPVPFARVQVRVAARQVKSVQTGPDGRFEAGGLDQGEITVKLRESNQGFIETEWAVVAAGDRSVRLVAEKGESISGFVYDAAGTPATSVSIEAKRRDGKSVASTWVHEQNGAFTLRGLPRGAYTITATRISQEAETQAAAAREAGTPASRTQETGSVVDVATGSTNIEIRLDK